MKANSSYDSAVGSRDLNNARRRNVLKTCVCARRIFNYLFQAKREVNNKKCSNLKTCLVFDLKSGEVNALSVTHSLL